VASSWTYSETLDYRKQGKIFEQLLYDGVVRAYVITGTPFIYVQTVDVLLLQYVRNILLLVIYYFIITSTSLAQMSRTVLNMNHADGRSLLATASFVICSTRTNCSDCLLRGSPCLLHINWLASRAKLGRIHIPSSGTFMGSHEQ